MSSTARARTISDLCPLRVTSSLRRQRHKLKTAQPQRPNRFNGQRSLLQLQLSGGIPTSHQWSQLTWGTNQGIGIMFTNSTNQGLYAFDKFAGAAQQAHSTLTSRQKQSSSTQSRNRLHTSPLSPRRTAGTSHGAAPLQHLTAQHPSTPQAGSLGFGCWPRCRPPSR